jgi:hypothetical protein
MTGGVFYCASAIPEDFEAAYERVTSQARRGPQALQL